MTLGQGNQATEAGQILTCPDDNVRTAHPIATKLGRYIPLIMLSTGFNFGRILPETFFKSFFRKISNLFFPNQTFYLPYLKTGWSSWCETQRKLVNWMLRRVGYLWPWHLTLNFQGQIVSPEWDFKVKSGICYISAKLVRLPRNQKQTYRLNARTQMGSSGMTLAMTLTLNFQGQIWNLLNLS